MNPIIPVLCEMARTASLPPESVSSHWQVHGRQTVVECHADTVSLRASGFPTVVRPGFGGRVLYAAERWSYRSVTAQLKSFPAVWQVVRRLLCQLGGGPDFHAFKSACVLATLSDHWAAQGVSPKTFMLIGDGDGFLGALIRRYLPSARLYCVDLPKTLVFQAQMHSVTDPSATLSLLGQHGRIPEVEASHVIFVLPQAIEEISEPIDCAINMTSMQEMTTEMIAAYFSFLRRRSIPQSRFYCVNRAHKELSGGEVIRFEDYPWQSDDEVFLDGVCPYYTHFFAPYTCPRGPRCFGLRVPYLNYFDGCHRHRLVRLAPHP